MRAPSPAPSDRAHSPAVGVLELARPCLGCGDPADPAGHGLCSACRAGMLTAAAREGLPLLDGVGARLAARIDFVGGLGDDPALGPCWLWRGARTDRGYGVARIDGKVTGVHRWAVSVARGPIPDGWEPDHRCHDWQRCPRGTACPQRACLRPTHLLVVPRRINKARSASPPAVNARKTRCDHGHPLAGANVYIHPQRNTRHCRTCQANTDAARRRRVA